MTQLDWTLRSNQTRLDMVTISIEMQAYAEKRHELLITLSELRELMSQAVGHQCSRIYVEPDNAEMIMLVEDWNSREAVDRYVRSDNFQVLLGAIKLLTKSATMTFFYHAPTNNRHLADIMRETENVASNFSHQPHTNLKGDVS